MSETNYSIDLKAAKGSKLFKKFLQGKNKSNLEPIPKVSDVSLDSKTPTIPISNEQSREHSQSQHNYPAQKINHESHFLTHADSAKQDNPTFTFSKGQIQDRRTERIVEKYQRKKQTDSLEQLNSVNYHNGANKKDEQPTDNHNRMGSPPRIATVMEQGIVHKKYNRLVEEYEEVMGNLNNQRKSHRTETLKLQQQVEALNKKVYELASREDDLIIENKRLKQRSQQESKNRVLAEENNRELGYQIQELKDMVDGSQQSMHKREQQISHLRKSHEDMKQEVKFLAAQNEKFQDIIHVYERQKNTVDREKETKETHIHELRERITTVINENSVLKDQIFHLTSKLYQIQQENKTLKADIRRQGEQFPMDYLYERMQQSYQQRSQQPTHENQNKISNEPSIEMERESVGRTNRRGEFAKERTQRRNRRQFAQQQQIISSKNNTMMGQKDDKREFPNKLRRFEDLQEQIQKIKDSKAINGAMRRQKITLQRELQQLQDYLKTHNQ